ncbi:MAG: IS5 family transposase [Candidatus Thorarchaeota archaeon]
MSYQSSYDAAKSRRYHFLLDDPFSLCNTVPDIRSCRGRPVEFPLPTLFVLPGLKFDSGLGYRNFVAYVNFNPHLLDRLGLDRAPHFSLLQKAVKRIDTRLIHRMYQLLARKRPPPRRLAVDSTGFSHSTGGEWVSVRLQRARKRRFHGLHSAVDTDSLMVHATHVRTRPGDDSKIMIPLVRRVSKRELETVYCDKAYISRRNIQFIADAGAYPAIEPKSSSSVNSRGHRACGQLMGEYRDDPDEWKRTHKYGRRSLVETVFSMMKLRHGGSLGSRRPKERRRELLIKLVLHNIERLNFLECAGT